jgi:hypothetical protein
MAQLTGKALLDKIKELGDVTQDVVARETGYVVTKKDGAERFQYQALYQATLAAKGINFAPPASGKAGRKLPYKAVVQKSGNIIISKGYTELHGAEEGHEFKIELLEDGSFKLSPIYEDEDAPAVTEAEMAAAA